MDLSAFGLERRRDAVLILGAGATRGASFVKPWVLMKPPTDADFFRLLRSSPIADDRESARLLDFVEKEFGSLDVSMERFYSQARLHDQFISDFSSGRGRRRDYMWNLRYFLRLLPRLFGVSLAGTTCEYHDLLAAALTPRDTILSFNYDCLMDRSLSRTAGRRWDPGRGYGFPVADGLDPWRDHSGRGRMPKGSIRLLKPHGSFNWSRDQEGQVCLLAEEYSRRDYNELVIVPPLWQKSFEEEPFPTIWSEARRLLSTVRALFVVGYSLPETDVYTQALLRMDVAALDFLAVVNPDIEARKRLHASLRSAVTRATHVVELDTLENLVQVIAAAQGRIVEYPGFS